jgi:tetratricopeptide (TPR) repeat protein
LLKKENSCWQRKEIKFIMNKRTFLFICFLSAISILMLFNCQALYSQQDKKEVSKEATNLISRVIAYYQAIRYKDVEAEKSFLIKELQDRVKGAKTKSNIPSKAGGGSTSKITLNYYFFQSLKISKDGKFGVTKVFMNFLLTGVPKEIEQVDQMIWVFDEVKKDYFIVNRDEELLFKFDEKIDPNFKPSSKEKLDYTELTADDFCNYFLSFASNSLEKKDYPKAIEFYKKAVTSDELGVWNKLPLENETFQNEILQKIYPVDYLVLIELGRVYTEKKMIDDAIKTYEKAKSTNPSNAIAYFRLGNIYFEQKNYQKAISEYKSSTSYSVDHAVLMKIFIRIGLCNIFLGNLIEAEQFLSLAFLCDPLGDERYLAYNYLGEVFTKQKRYDEALQAYLTSKRLVVPDKSIIPIETIDTAIESLLSKTGSYKELSDLLYTRLYENKSDKKFLSSFITTCEKALEKNPEFKYAMNYRIGEANYLLGEYKKSASFFEKILKEDPESIGSLLILKQNYMSEKNREKESSYDQMIKSVIPEISSSILPQDLIFIPDKIDMKLQENDQLRSVILESINKKTDVKTFFLKAPEKSSYLLESKVEKLVTNSPQKMRIFMDVKVDNRRVQRFVIENNMHELFTYLTLNPGIHYIELKFSSDNIGSIQPHRENLLIHEISLDIFDGRIIDQAIDQRINLPVDLILRSGNYNFTNMGDIIVDGKNVATKNRGYNMVAIDPTDGFILNVDFFDFFIDGESPKNLTKQLDSLPDGSIVCLASQDESSLKMNAEADNAMKKIGIENSLYTSQNLTEYTLNKYRGKLIKKEDEPFFTDVLSKAYGSFVPYKLRWSHTGIGKKGITAGQVYDFEMLSDKPVSIAYIPHQKANEYIIDGNKALESGNIDEAIKDFNNALKLSLSFSTFEKLPIYHEKFMEKIYSALEVSESIKKKYLGQIYISNGKILESVNALRESLNLNKADPMSNYLIAVGYFLNMEDERFLSSLIEGKKIVEKGSPYMYITKSDTSFKDNTFGIYNCSDGSSLIFNGSENKNDKQGWGFIAIDPEQKQIIDSQNYGSDSSALTKHLVAQPDGRLIIITFSDNNIIKMPEDLGYELSKIGVNISGRNYFKIYTLCFIKGGKPENVIEMISQFKPQVVQESGQIIVVQNPESVMKTKIEKAEEYVKAGLYTEGVYQFTTILNTYSDSAINGLPYSDKEFVTNILTKLPMSDNNMIRIAFNLLNYGFVSNAKELFLKLDGVDSNNNIPTSYDDYQCTIGDLASIGLNLIKCEDSEIKTSIEGILVISEKSPDNLVYIRFLGKSYYDYLKKKIIDGDFESFENCVEDKELVDRCIKELDVAIGKNPDDELRLYMTLFLLNNSNNDKALKILDQIDPSSSFGSFTKVCKNIVLRSKDKKIKFEEFLSSFDNSTDLPKLLSFLEITKILLENKNLDKLNEIKDSYGAERFKYPSASINLARFSFEMNLPYDGFDELFQMMKNNPDIKSKAVNVALDMINKYIEVKKWDSAQIQLIKCKLLNLVKNSDQDYSNCFSELSKSQKDCFACFDLYIKSLKEAGKDPEPIRQEIIKLIPYYPDIENLELGDQAVKITQGKDKNLFVFNLDIPKVFYASFENSTNKDTFDILLNMNDYMKSVTIGKEKPVYLFIKPEKLNPDLNIIEFKQKSDITNNIESVTGYWDGMISYKISSLEVSENIESLAVISSQSSSNIILNNEDISQNQLGYNLVTIDSKTGKIGESKNFNTFVDEKASTALAKFIKDQDKKTIIVGSIRWDGSKFLNEDALKALTSLGLKDSVKDKFSYCQSFITYRGNKENALEKISPDTAKILFLKK